MEIAQAIRDGDEDYVWSLQKNWSATLADVTMLFGQPPPGPTFEMNQTVDGCDGHIDTRRHTVCPETAG